MSTFEEQIASAVTERKDAIVKGMVDGAIEQVASSLRYQVSDSAMEIIREFIKTEVQPTVAKHLQDHRQEIIQSVLNGLDSAFAQCGDALANMASKNLAQSWNTTKLVEAIFK